MCQAPQELKLAAFWENSVAEGDCLSNRLTIVRQLLRMKRTSVFEIEPGSMLGDGRYIVRKQLNCELLLVLGNEGWVVFNLAPSDVTKLTGYADGATAVVWEGLDIRLQVPVALKVVASRLNNAHLIHVVAWSFCPWARKESPRCILCRPSLGFVCSIYKTRSEMYMVDWCGRNVGCLNVLQDSLMQSTSSGLVSIPDMRRHETFLELWSSGI